MNASLISVTIYLIPYGLVRFTNNTIPHIFRDFFRNKIYIKNQRNYIKVAIKQNVRTDL